MTSVFTWLVGTWFANFAFALHISNSWCATRNPVPDSAYHPGWFEECDHWVSECQSLHDSDTVKTSKLKNVRWKLNLCLLRRHLYTIQCRVTTLWYRSWLFGSFNWPWLPSWIGFFTARWQWQHVRAARARSSKQNTRANISVFCHIYIYHSIICTSFHAYSNFRRNVGHTTLSYILGGKRICENVRFLNTQTVHKNYTVKWCSIG